MTRAVRAACLLSLLIGLLFLFVRAPHPWGWNRFDHYHELALALASGRPFPTMEVPWGYAYFLSAFYRLFGDRPWIPLLVQVALNAITPMLLFAAARRWTDRATAARSSGTARCKSASIATAAATTRDPFSNRRPSSTPASTACRF